MNTPELCQEERLMEAVECSQPHRDFQRAAAALAAHIREQARQHGYDLAGALPLIENGQLNVHILDERGGTEGFTGLPAPVALFLTASACGGLFPQVPD